MRIEAVAKKIYFICRRLFQRNNHSEVYQFFYEKRYNKGCDKHPDLKEHHEIAALLIQFFKDKKLLGTL
jgi:hypothetical protein